LTALPRQRLLAGAIRRAAAVASAPQA